MLGRGYREFPQHYPQPGWVEHDPEELWARCSAPPRTPCGRPVSARRSCGRSGSRTSARPRSLWERRTGRPVAPRDRLAGPAHGRALPRAARRYRSARAPGLVPDPYFSATKLEWLLARTDLPQASWPSARSTRWLVWKLTGGRVHATDVTNASRTMLLDLRHARLGRRAARAVRCRPGAAARGSSRSSEVVGEAELLGATLPIAGIAGDQQAALFGQACFDRGSGEGDLRHRAASCSSTSARERATGAGGPARDGRRVARGAQYALEGAMLVGGAAIQWLRDGLGSSATAAESEALARSVDSTGGVVFVPALDRPRLAALECGCARADQRHHARHDARASRARGARGDRVPGRGRARRAPAAASRCCAPTAARAPTAS